MLLFGSGIVVLVPPGANPTPVPCATLSDVTLNEQYDEVELYGRYQGAEDVARSKYKLSGTIKMARITASMLTGFRAGATSSSGATKVSLDETHSVPPVSGPYTITVTNGATFVSNLGVYDVTAGVLMTRVASGPITGQYSIGAAGVYTFAAADTLHVIKFTYTYTSAGSGTTVVYTNQLMGAATTYQLHLWNSYDDSTGTHNESYVELPCVRIPKLNRAIKNTDHTMYDVDFAASAAADGTLITESTLP